MTYQTKNTQKNRWGLSSKVISIVVTILVVSLTPLFLVESWQKYQDLLNSEIRNARNMTRIITSGMSGGLRWGKAPIMERFYRDFEINQIKGLIALIGFDKKGKILLAKSADQELDVEGLFSKRKESLEDILEKKTPVFSQSESILFAFIPSHHIKTKNKYLKNKNDEAKPTEIFVGGIGAAWDITEIETRVVESVLFSVLISAIVLSVAIALLYLFLRKVVIYPLARLSETMLTLSRHDYNVTIIERDRTDEIGSIADALVTFKDSMIEADHLADTRSKEQEEKVARASMVETMIQDFEATVQDHLKAVSTASVTLESNANLLIQLANESGSQSEAVASASNQSSENVTTVVTEADALKASIAGIADQVTQSTNITDRAVKQAESSDQTVQGLNEAAEKIGHVINLIRDIASQTNLLALNATIEAARAGEAGKGFAVVASEVKSLAGQTSNATKDIEQQINTMQSVISQATAAIAEVGKTIGEVDDISEKIRVSIEQQQGATGKIATNVEEALVYSKEVSSSITNVSDAINKTESGAEEVLKAASNLKNVADNMTDSIESFVVRLRN